MDKVRRGFNASIPDAKSRAQAFMDFYKLEENQGLFESFLTRNLKLISLGELSPTEDAAVSFANFELDVAPELCNGMGNLHGAAFSLLVDMATSMAIVPLTKEGFWEHGGVSRTLNVTYLAPAVKGTTVVVECLVRSIGKRLATTQAIVRSKETGKVLALGEHGKVALGVQQRAMGIPKSKL